MTTNKHEEGMTTNKHERSTKSTVEEFHWLWENPTEVYLPREICPLKHSGTGSWAAPPPRRCLGNR